MSKLAIVGIFYDGYYDIWEDFLELFEKFWPNCPYEKYIVNDIKDLEFPKDYGFKVIHAGKDAEYSKRVQTAVSQIDADYLLLVLEDFFVGNPVSNQKIADILSFVESEGIKYYSMPLEDFQWVNKRPQYKNFKGLERLSPKDEYTICCQPAIFKKDFLRQCIGVSNYNAWVFEGVYTKSKYAHTEEFLNGTCVDNSNPLQMYHGALQSKMLPKTVEHFASVGYTFKNKREILSSKQIKKHDFKKLIKKTLPIWAQNFLKKVFKTNSVLERYNQEISAVMSELGID